MGSSCSEPVNELRSALFYANLKRRVLNVHCNRAAQIQNMEEAHRKLEATRAGLQEAYDELCVVKVRRTSSSVYLCDSSRCCSLYSIYQCAPAPLNHFRFFLLSLVYCAPAPLNHFRFVLLSLVYCAPAPMNHFRFFLLSLCDSTYL